MHGPPQPLKALVWDAVGCIHRWWEPPNHMKRSCLEGELSISGLHRVIIHEGTIVRPTGCRWCVSFPDFVQRSAGSYFGRISFLMRPEAQSRCCRGTGLKKSRRIVDDVSTRVDVSWSADTFCISYRCENINPCGGLRCSVLAASSSSGAFRQAQRRNMTDLQFWSACLLRIIYTQMHVFFWYTIIFSYLQLHLF